MADVDIAVDYLTPEESGSKAFDVWFKIAKLLNQVIGLYRPRSDGPVPELDTGFPGFEGIMDEMQAWQLSNSTVGMHASFTRYTLRCSGSALNALLT